MNLYIRCHYKNTAWDTNGRGTAIITLNSYRADHQSPVVMISPIGSQIKKNTTVTSVTSFTTTAARFPFSLLLYDSPNLVRPGDLHL